MNNLFPYQVLTYCCGYCLCYCYYRRNQDKNQSSYHCYHLYYICHHNLTNSKLLRNAASFNNASLARNCRGDHEGTRQPGRIPGLYLRGLVSAFPSLSCVWLPSDEPLEELNRQLMPICLLI